MLHTLIHVAGFNAGLLKKMLEDISDPQLCLQPPGLPNHPAWQVGHLAYVRFMVAKQLGATDAAYPEAWIPLFGRNSSPSANRAAYPSKAQLISTHEHLHAIAMRMVAALTPERLAGPHSIDSFKVALPTLGDLLLQMLIAHDGFHIGQIGDWRRSLKFVRIM